MLETRRCETRGEGGRGEIRELGEGGGLNFLWGIWMGEEGEKGGLGCDDRLFAGMETCTEMGTQSNCTHNYMHDCTVYAVREWSRQYMYNTCSERVMQYMYNTCSERE